jgi:hypothetical protein
MVNPDDLFVIAFFVFWFVLGIGGIAFFYGCKDATLKRRWYPRWGAFAMFCFCAFCAYEVGPAALAILIPWCIFSCYVSTHTTEFCDTCGATWINKYWTVKTRFCPRCGTNLTEAAQKRRLKANETTGEK